MKTVDAEVVVIAISLFHKFDLEELWTEFGTGFNLEWLPIHEYVENLRESICQAMPVWFVFTGCDTVSTFFARGKRVAWNTFKSYSAATDAFKMQVIISLLLLSGWRHKIMNYLMIQLA